MVQFEFLAFAAPPSVAQHQSPFLFSQEIVQDRYHDIQFQYLVLSLFHKKHLKHFHTSNNLPYALKQSMASYVTQLSSHDFLRATNFLGITPQKSLATKCAFHNHDHTRALTSSRTQYHFHEVFLPFDVSYPVEYLKIHLDIAV